MYNGVNVAITTSSAPWKILNGVASYDDSGNGTLAQDSVFATGDSGKTFKLTFTIQVGSSGNASIWIGNKLGSGNAYTSSNGYVSYGNGTHTIEIVPTDTTLGFWCNTGGGNFNIDNISCHEQHSRIGDTATFNGKVSIIGKTGYLLDVQQTAVAWTGRFENNGGAYGLSIDTANNIANNVPNLACYTPAGVGFFVQNQGRAGLGLTAPTQTLHIAANGSGSTAVDNHGYGLRVQDTNHAHGAIDILQNGDTATFVSRSNVQGGYEFKSYASVGTATHVRLKIKQNGETHIGSDAEGVAIHGNTSGLGSIVGVSRDGSAYKGLEVNGSPVYLKHAGATRLTTTSDGVFVSGSVTRTHKRGLYLNNNYPLNYSSEGETVWSINPQWSDTELQSFFNSTNVNFQNDSTAPAGYSVYIAGNVNVGATYGSPFPMIPVEPDTIIYCECWVKDAGAVGHYMGSIEYKEDFGQPSTGSGNPGSYGYWVMINTSPGTSGWTKVHGYLGPNTGSSTGQWETGTKYFTPQALFNYTHSSGTRGTYISGWKYIRVSQAGKRTFSDPIGVNTTADSQDALSIKSTGDGRNALVIKDNSGDALFNVRQSANDCLIRGYKDGGTQTLQLHSDGESYIKGGAGGGTDLSLGGPGVTSHGTLVLNNSGGSAIGKVRCEGSDDSFYVSKLAGGGAFNITSNNDIIINSTDNVSIGASDLSSYAESPFANNLIVGSNDNHNGMTIVSGSSHIGSVYFADGTNGNQKYRGYIQYEHGNERFSLGVGGAVRAWIDTDGLKFAANHYIRNENGIKQIRFRSGGANEIVFNEDGRSDVDVRMEGDGDANLFFLDSSTDRIAIGSSSPSNKFHITQALDIAPSSSGTGQFAVTGNGYTTFLCMDATAAYFGHNSSGRHLRLMTNETTRLAIDGSGTYIHSYTNFLPVSNGSYTLGGTSNRWSNVYSVLGTFSGNVTIGAKLKGGTGSNSWNPTVGLVYDAGVSTSYDLISVGNNNGEHFNVKGDGSAVISANLTLNSRITFSGGSNQYLEVGTNSIALKNSGGTVLWNSSDSGGGGGGGVTGSGTDQYIPRWNGTGALENSNIFSKDGSGPSQRCVGIGTASPGYLFHVVGNAVCFEDAVATLALNATGSGGNTIHLKSDGGIFKIRNASAGNELYHLKTGSSGYHKWYIADSAKMYLSSSGYLGILSTSPSYPLHVNGEAYVSSRMAIATTVDSSYGLKVAGYIASYGHTTWSDYRLKDDTALWDTSEAASLVKDVPVYSYKWNDKCEAKEVQTQDRIGFLAHEVSEKINKNNLVINEKDGKKYQSVNQTDMIPILWAALQEALKRIEELENK
jgi:hypothetical protein